MKKLFSILGILLVLSSCTEQDRARRYGGTETFNLEPGEELIEVTWKDETHLWYLVKPMEPGYKPQTKIFKENDPYTHINGKVIFIEHEK